MRIDGGPTLADFESFNNEMVNALIETYQDQDKFDRFANRVLGESHTANAAASLRQDLLQQTEVLEQRNLVNAPNSDQPKYGFARLDAVGAIFNQVMTVFNHAPDKGVAADAPVSYPFLWGTHQSDYVQWPGFAPNGPASAGALIRNGGEVLGVFGQLDIPENQEIKHYSSSLNIPNLGLLEQWVAELRSPAWPAEYLPPVDIEMATKGSELYAAHCESCHQVIAREDEGQSYKACLTPQSIVLTDAKELTNIATMRSAGIFQGRKEFVLFGDEIGAETTGLNPLVNSVVGSLLEHPIDTIKAAIVEYEGGLVAKQANDGITSGDQSSSPHVPSELSRAIKAFEELRSAAEAVKAAETASADDGETNENCIALGTTPVYKARPLNGIWATAPYLHNGSVPNLYELLLPADQRSKTFHVGTREFDPVNVGYDLQVAANDPDSFKLDTSLSGNSNEGHEFLAGGLSEEQRKQLVEYLKTL